MKARFRSLLRQAVWLLCASTCACGEDVIKLGKSDTAIADMPIAPTPLTVESLLLRQAETSDVISDLATTTPISIASLASSNVSLEAVVTGNVGSVEFVVDGKATIEHVTPFTYPGDTDGNLQALTAVVGEHTVVAAPYSLLDAKGEQGTALSRTFTFAK